MSTLDFNTVIEKQDKKEKGKKGHKIRLDGREMAVRLPSPTRLAMTQRAVERQQFSKFLDQMMSMFKDEADVEYILERLDDENDPFDVYDPDEENPSLLTIWQKVVEVSTARPTQRPSGSAGSQKPTGKGSTGGARPKAKRRSTSQQTGS